jgi:uncharacterized protein (DUF983 family)
MNQNPGYRSAHPGYACCGFLDSTSCWSRGCTTTGSRHYDPMTGRYTQADPLEFVDGPSGSAAPAVSVTLLYRGLSMKCPRCGMNVSISRIFLKLTKELSCTNCNSRLKVSGGYLIEAIVTFISWPILFVPLYFSYSLTAFALGMLFFVGIVVVLVMKLAQITVVDEEV